MILSFCLSSFLLLARQKVDARVFWTSSAGSPTFPAASPLFFHFPIRFTHRPPEFLLGPDEEAAVFESRMTAIESAAAGGDRQSEQHGDGDVNAVLSALASMNWTQAENQLLQRLTVRWQFEQLLNFLFAKVLELPTEPERSSALALLDRYGPPKSLVQALEAMTIEQKGHIQQLVEASSRRRTADLRRIARGLVASLPDEDQPQAERFIRMIRQLFHLW